MNVVPDIAAAAPNKSEIPDAVAAPHPNLYRQLRILIAGIVVPMLLLTVAVIFVVSRVTEQRTAEGIMQTARSVMSSTEAELKGHMAALRLLAGSPALQSGDLAAFRPEAERFVATFHGSLSNVIVSDAEGNILLSVLPLKDRIKRGNLAGVQEAFARRNSYISDMYMGAVTGRPTFTIDTPVIVDGEVRYVLGFNPSRDTFFNITDSLQLPAGWVVSIFDRNYRHVARHPSLGREELTSGAESLKAEMSASPEGVARTSSLEGVTLLTAFTRSPTSGWTVAIGVPASHLSQSVNRAIMIALAVGAVFYVAAAAIALRMSRAVTSAETQRVLLINELNHRVKNTLAGVQAIVSQTLRRTTDPGAVRNAIQNRLMAMSRAHDVLSKRHWMAVGLADLVRVILQAYEDSALNRVTLAGPPVVLVPRQAVPLALIVNELATNALKYGALSVPVGSLAISWRRVDDDVLLLSWEEFGAPAAVPVTPPAPGGFGTFFIERAVLHELRGEVVREYAPDGLKVRIQFPLDAGLTA